jgi:hypothetical protein
MIIENVSLEWVIRRILENQALYENRDNSRDDIGGVCVEEYEIVFGVSGNLFRDMDMFDDWDGWDLTGGLGKGYLE